MSRKSKVFLGVVLVALAVVALTATTAFAAPAYSVSLAISRTSGTYGDEFVVTPTLEGTQTVVGDTYAIQALQPDGVTWENFGEGLKVDETGTVVPQYLSVDESFLPWYWGGTWHPTVFKVIYKTPRSKDTSGAQIAYEGKNDVTFTVKRLKKAKVVGTAPKSVKRNRTFAVGADVSPIAGIGNMRMSIYKGSKQIATTLVQTDATGFAAAKAKLLKRGTYQIRIKWLGNNFGPASSVITKRVIVR